MREVLNFFGRRQPPTTRRLYRFKNEGPPGGARPHSLRHFFANAAIAASRGLEATAPHPALTANLDVQAVLCRRKRPKNKGIVERPLVTPLTAPDVRPRHSARAAERGNRMPFSPSPRGADRSIAGNCCCEDLSVLRSAERAKPPVIAPTAQGASWLYSSVTRVRDNLMKSRRLVPNGPQRHSLRQLLANAAIGASRVGSTPQRGP